MAFEKLIVGKTALVSAGALASTGTILDIDTDAQCITPGLSGLSNGRTAAAQTLRIGRKYNKLAHDDAVGLKSAPYYRQFDKRKPY